jgi:hypothetical protein
VKSWFGAIPCRRATSDTDILGAIPASHSSIASIQTAIGHLHLTAPEREALTKAISREVLDEQDWHEGTHGEILKGKRVIFDVGFAKATCRVLGV